ncbi:MAG TPA: hypothetical protein VFI52_08795 [Gemmatimonadaceae bacterium]|nr:hypothetical protein [Gemmatimonadaceae bacterium]
MTRVFHFPDPAGGEPVRDERLGALLRDTVGEPPMADVDWTALADRIGAAVRMPRATPWWGHVERWQRRALPLAIAAGLVGALALWSAAGSSRSELVAGNGDLVTAVVSGASSIDAADTYAGAVAGSADLVTGVPE